MKIFTSTLALCLSFCVFNVASAGMPKADELLSMLMASQGLAAEAMGPAFISKNPQLRAFTPVVAKPDVGLLKPKHGRRAP